MRPQGRIIREFKSEEKRKDATTRTKTPIDKLRRRFTQRTVDHKDEMLNLQTTKPSCVLHSPESQFSLTLTLNLSLSLFTSPCLFVLVPFDLFVSVYFDT